MNPHTKTSELAQLICDAIADTGRDLPWVVRLHATRRLVDLFLHTESSIVQVRGAIYTRAAQARLRGEMIIPRSRFELEELQDQFGPTFAAIGFDTTHALITTRDFWIEVACAADLTETPLLPLSARVVEGEWDGDADLVIDLPFGCVATDRIEHGTPPRCSDEDMLAARWLEIRAAARLRWMLDAPQRRSA